MAKKKALAHTRLNKLRQDLAGLVEARQASYPKSGPRYEIEKVERSHAQVTKDSLAKWLKAAREEASVVSLDSFLPAVAEVDSLQPDHLEAMKFAQRLREGVDVILNRLA